MATSWSHFIYNYNYIYLFCKYTIKHDFLQSHSLTRDQKNTGLLLWQTWCAPSLFPPTSMEGASGNLHMSSQKEDQHRRLWCQDLSPDSLASLERKSATHSVASEQRLTWAWDQLSHWVANGGILWQIAEKLVDIRNLALTEFLRTAWLADY